MGAVCFSSSSTELVGRNTTRCVSIMMYKVCAALLLAGAALASPVAEASHGGHGGHGGHGHKKDRVECHVVYDIVHNKHCETYHEEVCHEEYDVVVDTTYIEECADIVTQHCSETSKQVHHSSAIVGHDSQLIHGGHYAKRDAEAEPGYGYAPHNNLQCFSKPHKQCHQRPVQNQRQVCHEEYDTIVDTTYIEQCQDIVTQHCQQVSKQVHHSSAVVGHDTQVVAGGYGYGAQHYGKREASPEAAPGGYSTGPICQEHVERQCHKVPQAHERKVPRQVCHSVPREQCHPTAHKVAREVCQVVDKKGRPYGYGHH